MTMATSTMSPTPTPHLPYPIMNEPSSFVTNRYGADKWNANRSCLVSALDSEVSPPLSVYCTDSIPQPTVALVPIPYQDPPLTSPTTALLQAMSDDDRQWYLQLPATALDTSTSCHPSSSPCPPPAASRPHPRTRPYPHPSTGNDRWLPVGNGKHRANELDSFAFLSATVLCHCPYIDNHIFYYIVNIYVFHIIYVNQNDQWRL